MLRSIRLAGLLATALTTFSFTAAHASDPADVAYWQSVQGSKNPKEYDAYLHAFPQGAFAELARERVKELSGDGNQLVSGGNAQPTGLGPVVGKGVITVVPENPQVGDTIHLTLQHFPKLSSSDTIVIVPVGSPDTITAAGGTATSWDYAVMCVDQSNPEACKFGPLAPGSYEVRWLTTLYNNQQKYQVGARTQFTVSD